jgi:hypothetical protein
MTRAKASTATDDQEPDILDELVEQRVTFLLSTGDSRSRAHLTQFVRSDYEERVATARDRMGR